MEELKLESRKTIPPEEHKKIQLEILRYFADFCKNNGLTYFLSDGTLLGAIRHNGYIPWDDDTDVDMPRPDYNKLKELFVDQGDYVLVAPEDPMSRFYSIKIFDKRTIKIESGVKYSNDYLGVDIDVFPIDGSDPDEKVYKRDREKIKRLFDISCMIKRGRLIHEKQRSAVDANRKSCKGDRHDHL